MSSPAFRLEGDEWTRAWVRLVDGRLVVTWQQAAASVGRASAIGAGWRRGGTRPLTFRERLAWRLLRKVPRP